MKWNEINTLLQVNEFHKYNENTWGPSVIRDIYLTSTHSSHPVTQAMSTNKLMHVESVISLLSGAQ
jgi:hypothetical protein